MSGLKAAVNGVRLNFVFKRSIDLFITFFFVALIGRVFVFNTAAPFGAAFIAACFLNGQVNVYAVTAGAVFGAATLDPKIAVFYISVNALTAVLMYAITRILKKDKKWMAFIAAGISYSAMTALIREKVLFTLLLGALELAFIFLTIYVFEAVLNVCLNSRRRSVLTEEEVLGIAFIAIIFVLGMGEINICGVYLSNVLAIFFAMVFSYLGGAATGAAAAVALAAASAIGGSASPLFICSLSICALLAGVLKKIKKAGTAAGFVLANAVVTFLINASETVVISLIESAAATVFFMAVPEKIYKALGKFVDLNIRRTFEQEMHFRRFKQATISRLKEVSEVFKKTGEVFNMAASGKSKYAYEVSRVLALVAEKTCEYCASRDNCWDGDFPHTYGVLKKLYMNYEEEGGVIKSNIPESFRRKCGQLDAMIKNCESVFDAYSASLAWKRRVDESRYVTGEQLMEVSRIIGALGSEMDVGMTFLDDAEKEVMHKLDEAGIHAKEVCVEKKGGAVTARIKIRSFGKETACADEVEKAVSEGCMRIMVRKNGGCLLKNKKNCELIFEEQKKFKVLTGLAQASKNGVSGDRHSFLGLKDGRYLLMLCDGMGSGEKALRESEAAVSLIENFYLAGFDDNIVFDTINRLMVLKSPDEVFSTVDLCMLNLIEGYADFTKIGAERSYIFRNEEIYTINSGTLPIGILDEVSPLTIRKSLKENDTVVMFTDGIGDAEPEGLPAGEWIKNIIREEKNAQTAADNILKAAMEMGKEEQKDDMSVLVARIVL